MNIICVIITSIIIIIILCVIFYCCFNYYSFFKNENKIVLITEYFKHKIPERENEINNSINLNINNKFINKIYFLSEKDTILNDNYKVKNKITNKRLTYKDAFNFANSLPLNTIVIIANNDVSFDNTLDIFK